MFTASHNPAQYNGIKMCRAYAAPIGMETGLAEIRDLVAGGETTTAEPARARSPSRTCSPTTRRTSWTLAPVSGRRLKVVVDAGNGMAGLTAPAVLGQVDVEVVELYFELDGTFPNHEANPIEPANLVDLQAEVRETGADIGLAFDGDADRCFLVDERGELVSPSVLTALIAARELAKDPGATIIHNLITSRGVPEIVARARRQARAHPRRALLHQGADGRDRGGLRRRALRATSTSATSGAPTPGMLAALHALAALAETDQPLSEVLAPYARHVASGEINSEVEDQQARARRARADLGRARRRRGGPPRRAHRHPRRLVVQCSRVQHRTPAAAQRRGRGRSHHGAGPRRCPGRDQKERPMNLDSHLLDVVVCPACRQSLAVDEAAEELVCVGCGLAYPVRDDIPVLLVDEARKPA